MGHACTYSNVIPGELVICDKSISLTCGSNGGVGREMLMATAALVETFVDEPDLFTK